MKCNETCALCLQSNLAMPFPMMEYSLSWVVRVGIDSVLCSIVLETSSNLVRVNYPVTKLILQLSAL
jgi:hypothetical protein